MFTISDLTENVDMVHSEMKLLIDEYEKICLSSDVDQNNKVIDIVTRFNTLVFAIDDCTRKIVEALDEVSEGYNV